MKIGILGTGVVGHTIGTKLIQIGHQVMMGSRKPDNEKSLAWVQENGVNASQGSFAQAAAFGELVFNCTAGGVSLEALSMAGADNLNGKILIDLSNPLDFSRGMPPVLIPEFSNTTSLGEEIQESFPDVKVVKSLNTMTCALMVNPAMLAGEHDVFVSGNDAEAKRQVAEYLRVWFGWKSVLDLGNISTACGTEMVLPLWLRLWGALQTPNFNFKIVK